MDKVYIVTEGDYSDYHIVCVFKEDEKELAEKYASLCSGFVEEHEFKKILTDSFFQQFEIHIYEPEKKYLVEPSYFSEAREYNIIKETKEYYNKPRWSHEVYVRAKDKEHAVKIALDLFAKYKAKKEGIA